MLSAKRIRIILILVFVSLFAVVLSMWRAVTPSYADEPSNIYLPLIARNFPPPPTVFGAESTTFTDPDLIQLAVDAKVSWIRIPAIDWRKIEATKGVYDWGQVLESSLKNISDNHMYAIATVKNTPSWAQKYPADDPICGPIAQDSFDEFAAFMQAAVERYSKSPYNVHHWEIGNEPDVNHELLSRANQEFYGCWGDSDDAYYGGGYYAEMLKVVYPAIKAVDPQAQILIGGLLLSCDPDNVDTECKDPIPPTFFEGILRNGGGAYFDMVSFHGYPYFNGGRIRDEDFPGWEQRGGVVLGKADFLREVMAQYGVDKPLFHTEGALLCPDFNLDNCGDDKPDAIFEDAKADYVVWLFVRALANEFEGSIWYTLHSSAFRGGELIGDINDPHPSYHAYKFITKELSGAQYIGQPLGTGGDLRAYSFSVPGKTVWVVWSIDGLTNTLVLPTGYTNVYDKLGNLVTVTDGLLDVKSPIYIELP